MIYQIIAVLVIVIAIILVLVAAKLLLNKKWIAGFLRGTLGILLLLVTVILGFSAQDVFSYRAIENNKSIATISFRKKDGNNYHVEIQESAGKDYTAAIEGQQWQLNVRMLKWPPLLGVVGFRTGYRLDSVTGRFLELQLDKMAGKPAPEILNSSQQIDVWQFLNQNTAVLPVAETYMGTPGFIPVGDGAIYDVVLSGQNLTVNPLNDVAKAALQSW